MPPCAVRSKRCLAPSVAQTGPEWAAWGAAVVAWAVAAWVAAAVVLGRAAAAAAAQRRRCPGARGGPPPNPARPKVRREALVAQAEARVQPAWRAVRWAARARAYSG